MINFDKIYYIKMENKCVLTTAVSKPQIKYVLQKMLGGKQLELICWNMELGDGYFYSE